jgi:hypothetical protein
MMKRLLSLHTAKGGRVNLMYIEYIVIKIRRVRALIVSGIALVV